MSLTFSVSCGCDIYSSRCLNHPGSFEDRGWTRFTLWEYGRGMNSLRTAISGATNDLPGTNFKDFLTNSNRG